MDVLVDDQLLEGYAIVANRAVPCLYESDIRDVI